MVYTLTFSPSIDYVVHLDNEFEAGNINNVREEFIQYGGKGVNVSQVLQSLGVDNIALGFVAGFTGDEIERGLEKLGCKSDFIHLSTGHSRINVKIKAKQESEINAQGPYVDEQSILKLYEKIENIDGNDTLILAGRIPKNMPNDLYTGIFERLNSKETRIIIDTTGENLINALAFKPFLIKPNHHELGALFNEEFTVRDKERIVAAARLLQEKGARNVLVSLADEGAILVTEGDDVYIRNAPEGIAINSVGAGDSMVAGFLAGFLETGDMQEALVLGIAAGSATAFVEGLASGEEIRQLYRFIG